MKKVGFKRLALSLAVVLGLSVVGCGSQPTATSGTKTQEKIVAKFTHVTAPQTPKGKAAQKFADLVNERSKGRLEINVYPSGQLFGDKDEMEALQANNVQFISPSAGKLVSFDKRFQIGDVPFLFNDNAAESKFWDGEKGQALMKGLQAKGIIGFTTWPNGMRQMMNSKQELKVPDDYKGMKFRIPSGGVLVDTFKALGAGATVIPFSDTYTALQQKVVDGTIATFDNIAEEKYAEVLKYLTVANVNSLSYVVLMNKSFYDGLPKDLQDIVHQAMKEATDYERQLSDQSAKDSMEKLKKSIKVHETTPEERQLYVKAMKPVWDKYEPIMGKDLFEAAQKANQ
ncbi:MAG: DctP family TRAP transporter solute-binding subunit [Desulfitobacteriaceae bacterium]|nr:DctP family TRAP transporter solute-binding subunit [Desulfitobacteriaceae bacterium]MDI6880585.1 DctP family TRAP transporter solute-binding subunit [Desulfitobacteriaceae bacterium]MDI6914635.1 DctP family TRAP transporter solute-binding subunit [Desulfitobacteriaceae bacterium]